MRPSNLSSQSHSREAQLSKQLELILKQAEESKSSLQKANIKIENLTLENKRLKEVNESLSHEKKQSKRQQQIDIKKLQKELSRLQRRLQISDENFNTKRCNVEVEKKRLLELLKGRGIDYTKVSKTHDPSKNSLDEDISLEMKLFQQFKEEHQQKTEQLLEQNQRLRKCIEKVEVGLLKIYKLSENNPNADNANGFNADLQVMIDEFPFDTLLNKIQRVVTIAMKNQKHLVKKAQRVAANRKKRQSLVQIAHNLRNYVETVIRDIEVDAKITNFRCSQYLRCFPNKADLIQLQTLDLIPLQNNLVQVNSNIENKIKQLKAREQQQDSTLGQNQQKITKIMSTLYQLKTKELKIEDKIRFGDQQEEGLRLSDFVYKEEPQTDMEI